MTRPLKAGERILLADIAHAVGPIAVLDAVAPDLLTGLRTISDLPDPKPGDRAPLRYARHVARCLLKAMEAGPG
jgi:hypothetical protein